MKKLDNKAQPEIIDDEREVKELIHQIKNGSSRAFTQLVDRYHNQVASVAYKVINDYDEAADIAQSVFVKVSNNIWRYDEKKKFYTWLYRITINASIDHMRKHKRHRHEPLDNIRKVMEDLDATPDVDYQRKQLNKYINQAAENLNDKQKSAFLLRDVEGCKINDVAEIMNMPEATVRWYLHRARHKVKRELLRKCPQLLMLFGFK